MPFSSSSGQHPIALDSCFIKLDLALFKVQIRGASGAANLGSGLPKLNNSVVSRRWTKCCRTCVITADLKSSFGDSLIGSDDTRAATFGPSS
jgi:hypothetical protein